MREMREEAEILSSDIPETIVLAPPWKYYLSDDASPRQLLKIAKLPFYLSMLFSVIEKAERRRGAVQYAALVVESLDEWVQRTVASPAMASSFPGLDAKTAPFLSLWSVFVGTIRGATRKTIHAATCELQGPLLEATVAVANHVHNAQYSSTPSTVKTVLAWASSLLVLHFVVLVAAVGTSLAGVIRAGDAPWTLVLTLVACATFPMYVSRLKAKGTRRLRAMYGILNSMWWCLQAAHDTLDDDKDDKDSQFSDSQEYSGNLMSVKINNPLLPQDHNTSPLLSNFPIGMWGTIAHRIQDEIATASCQTFFEQFFIVQVSTEYLIQKWALGAETLTGFPQSDMVGKNITALFANGDGRAIFDKLIADCYNEGFGETARLQLVCFNQASLSVSTSAMVLRSLDGKVRGIFVTCRSAPPQASLSGILAAWNHSWYTKALTTILSACVDPSVADPIRNRLDHMSPAVVERFAANTNLTVVNIRAMIGAISDVWRTRLLGKGILLVEDIADDVPVLVSLLEDRVHDVIFYLVHNAVRFTAAGELNTIEIAVTFVRDVSSVVFTVRDSGCGMTPEVAKRIQKWNYAPTTDATPTFHKMQNTALSMCGMISCQTSPTGCTVDLTLPFVIHDGWAQDQEALNKSSFLMGLKCSSPLNFLVLEGSTLHRTVIGRQLMAMGHGVSVTKGFHDLIEIISRSSHFAAVFVDVMGTLETFGNMTALLRNESRDVAVVLTSDRFTSSELSVEGFYYLTKPFQSKSIQDLVHRLEELQIERQKSDKEISRIRGIFAVNKHCEWKRLETIGSGSFGVVCKAVNLLTGGTMAVKTVTLDSEAKTNELLNELEMLATLEHRNIIHYLYCERADNAVNIFMEYADGGSLAELLEASGSMSPQVAAGCLRDVLHGVSHLHQHGVVHRDIKTANILISRKTYKIADFQTATRMKPKVLLTEMVGTLRFMAPEIFGGNGYSWQCDIWSIGCLLLELLTGHRPFNDVEDVRVLLSDLSRGRDSPSVPIPTLPSDYANHGLSFISSCLQVDYRIRPTARDLLNHPFVNPMGSSDSINNRSTISVFSLKEDFDRKFSSDAMSSLPLVLPRSLPQDIQLLLSNPTSLQ